MKFLTKIRNYVKEALNPIDVYSSQRFLLMMSLIYGLIPYKLVGDQCKQNNQRLKTTIFGFIAAILYMLFFSFCFYTTIIEQMNLMEFFLKSPISNFGGNLNLVTSFFSITSVYMSSLYLRKKVKAIFCILIRIDQKLFELGIEINHKNALMYNFKCSVGAIVVYCIYSLGSLTILVIQDNTPRISVLVTHFLPYLVLTILIFTFLNFARLIYARFAATNKVSLRMQNDREEVMN